MAEPKVPFHVEIIDYMQMINSKPFPITKAEREYEEGLKKAFQDLAAVTREHPDIKIVGSKGSS